MTLRAHTRLFLSYLVLVVGVVLALVWGVETTLRQPLLDQAGDELLRELALGRELLELEGDEDPDGLARRMADLTGHRVTIVGAGGEVLGESGVPRGAIDAMDDHSDRPEIQAAWSSGQGTSIRYSTSVDADLVYAAVEASGGRVIRFAMDVGAIDAAIASVRRQILQVGGVALLLALLLSLAVSLAVTRPLREMRRVALTMARGDLGPRLRMGRHDELGELASALDTLADQLQRRLGQFEAEREEMAVLIDSMAEGVLALDARGQVRRANPAARAIFGLNSEVEGSAPQVVARHRGFLEMVSQVLDGLAVPPTELTHGDLHLLATAEPLPRGGAVLVFLDITELRRLEGVRRDFVANASHELKTPLTVIRGHAETLLDEELPPELRRRFAQRLQANADRLQAILEDLLDLSKIESGGWQPEIVPIQVSELAGEAWEPFRAPAQEKGVVFELDVDRGAQEVLADPGGLRQVLTNLFSNALRHTPSGGRICLRGRVLAGGEMALEVEDTGSGIPTRHLGRIFERFYRADPARSRADGGTGLGLAIVRHLVEQHGGRVEAESELGEGTTIRVILPMEVPVVGRLPSAPESSVRE